MSEPTWGMLAKNQEDNETIEQAIDRLIEAHLADSNAHLEEGESLQSHRASEIIDHLATSIVEDKIKDGEVTGPKITNDQIVGKDIRTATDVGEEVDGVKFNSSGIEMYQNGKKRVNIPISGDPEFDGNLKANRIEYKSFYFYSIFESIDGWMIGKYGAGSDVTGKIAEAKITTGANNLDYAILTTDFSSSIQTFTDSNFEFECIAKIDDKTDGYMTLGLTDLDGYTYANKAWFKWDRLYQELYAVTGNGTTESETWIEGIDPEAIHRYKIKQSGTDILFYVDGVLKHTESTIVPSGTGQRIGIVLQCSSDGAGTTYVIVRMVKLTADTQNFAF